VTAWFFGVVGLLVWPLSRFTTGNVLGVFHAFAAALLAAVADLLHGRGVRPALDRPRPERRQLGVHHAAGQRSRGGTHPWFCGLCSRLWTRSTPTFRQATSHLRHVRGSQRGETRQQLPHPAAGNCCTPCTQRMPPMSVVIEVLDVHCYRPAMATVALALSARRSPSGHAAPRASHDIATSRLEPTARPVKRAVGASPRAALQLLQ